MVLHDKVSHSSSRRLRVAEINGWFQLVCLLSRLQSDSRFASLCASEKYARISSRKMTKGFGRVQSITRSTDFGRAAKRGWQIVAVFTPTCKTASIKVRMQPVMIVPLANAIRLKKNSLRYARFERNANSRNDQSASAHLSSPTNLLPGACPIKFSCLSAYSRAMMEQWIS